MSICEYLGIDLEYIVWGLAGVVLFMFLLLLINMVKMSNLRKKYKKFMGDTDANSLEEKIVDRLDQIDGLVESNENN